MSVQVGTVGELVTRAGNVGGETGVGNEAGDDRTDVSALVPEVVGVLGLDECVCVTRKSARGSGEGASDDGSTVVVKLALLVEIGQVIAGKLQGKRLGLHIIANTA